MSSNFRYHMLKSVKPYSVYMPQLTKSSLRVLIQVSVHYIETKKSSPDVLALAINKLKNAGHEVPKNFCELFTMVLLIMQMYLRYPKGVVKDQELRQCLTDDLSFTDVCADDLTKVLLNHRTTLSRNFAETKMERAKMQDMQWRINISLSSSMAQLNKPTIVLHFKLNNGEYRTLELPLTMFQRLRYSVAMLLSELQALQNRPVLKQF
ncbi:COMM domain-containing protein 5 [Drosophila grimshawi]|uniref:COMM domain-containing protein 5 n=1 Tax=Drosophila grimshawi TaxID=7222 RepID=B4JPZ5_DROGR|nr:COMM domain-containing protein 5 [Drosophila grimshawi]EDV98975.1 GH13611 [Drosophila grimshawi]